jgi:hypothetical protein
LIVYLSSHSVITIIMVWRVLIYRTATLGLGVEEADAIVEDLRRIGDAGTRVVVET